LAKAIREECEAVFRAKPEIKNIVLETQKVTKDETNAKANKS
jgi:hypothetical protein